MLSAGDKAPSFSLPAIDGGAQVSDPWTDDDSGAGTLVAFFKTNCPVCKMVAPMLTTLSEGGVRVVAVGEDAPDDIAAYNEAQGQRVQTLSEDAPYSVSEAFGLEAVPTIFVIGADGEVRDAIAGWNRDTWNAMAASLGIAEPLSTPEDGLRPFRPG